MFILNAHSSPLYGSRTWPRDETIFNFICSFHIRFMKANVHAYANVNIEFLNILSQCVLGNRGGLRKRKGGCWDTIFTCLHAIFQLHEYPWTTPLRHYRTFCTHYSSNTRRHLSQHRRFLAHLWNVKGHSKNGETRRRNGITSSKDIIW